MPISRVPVRDVAAWADAWLSYRRRTLQIPGLQFAIAWENPIAQRGTRGMADVSTGEPLTNRHAFHITSHSKTFTATAILQVAEVDPPALRLDDRLSEYLPASHAGLPGVEGRTIGDLLNPRVQAQPGRRRWRLLAASARPPGHRRGARPRGAQRFAIYFSAPCPGDDRLLSDEAKRRMQHASWTPRGQ